MSKDNAKDGLRTSATNQQRRQSKIGSLPPDTPLACDAPASGVLLSPGNPEDEAPEWERWDGMS